MRTRDGLDHLDIGYRTATSLAGRSAAGRVGLFCLSDLIAYGTHRALVKAGRRVPQEVVLVGFDDIR